MSGIRDPEKRPLYVDRKNGRLFAEPVLGTPWKEFSIPYPVASVNGATGDVVLAAADVGAATSAQGALADTALQPGSIGVTVQPFNASIVIDALYVHTDNNYTTTEKNKLAGIAAGAEVNVNADWNASSGDAQILNKPALGTAAAANTTDFATAAQGSLAATALQPSFLDTAQTWTKGQRGEVTTLSDAATIAIDFADSNNFTVTLGGNRVLGNPSNAVAGQSGAIAISQGVSGGRALTYSSNWKFSGGGAPVLTTAANAVDVLMYYVVSSTFIVATLLPDVK